MFNRRAAYVAGLAAAAVHIEGLLEITGAAFGADKVAQGGAALLDGLLQQAFDVGDEVLRVVLTQAVAGAAWVDAGKKQGFVGVDIADADDKMRVHQHGFDGCFAFE